MATKIRAELSNKNKYWISRHRYYELKHFCLQYPQWKKEYEEMDDLPISTTSLIKVDSDNKTPSDLVSKYAIEKACCYTKIEMIENAAKKADEFLYPYIIKAVTEELSFTYLKARLEIPCSKDMYYDRYRKFFWYLNRARS